MMSWDEKQLHWHLTTRRFGRQCRYFAEIDSTNHWLLANSAEFTLSGAVVVAGHQSRGRGRYDRKWEDESGQALLCSLLLQMSRLPKASGWIPMLPAISLARAIRRHDRSAIVALKWPNDVLIENCKVAGVLAETVTGGHSHDVVVGSASTSMDSRQGWKTAHLYRRQASSRQRHGAQTGRYFWQIS
ncbi:MAG: biotin--[acetyl-CoA-carboxylase] ligase [bacterium]|nr:biotin--[acetyl-CoA-carboxylase] ligase [bacterium]